MELIECTQLTLRFALLTPSETESSVCTRAPGVGGNGCISGGRAQIHLLGAIRQIHLHLQENNVS